VAEERNEQTQDKLKVGRRTLVRWFLGIGAVSSVAGLTSVLGTVQRNDSGADTAVQVGDPLVFAVGTNQGESIKRSSIQPGQGVLAYPRGKEIQENLVLVLHLNEADFTEPTVLEWTSEGLVAYSAICTHLGCTVNFSHEGMEGAPYPHLHCPCHTALFNPQQGAEVVGGPAPRPLPQLPVTVDEAGIVIVAGPFGAPVGVL
jgi:rieske iron-sulfur protein